MTQLFDAVHRDDADTVMRLLVTISDPNLKHPETGKTLLLVAAEQGARRVVESLHQDVRQAVVDTPFVITSADGTSRELRAADVAAGHARDFPSTSLSQWNAVLQEIEFHEASGRARLKSGLKGWSHSHSRHGSGNVGDAPPLEDKAVLIKQLNEMLDRIRPLIDLKPSGPPTEFAGKSLQPMEIVGCDAKAILKQERETLQTLRPALRRWGDFIQQLIDIGARPLPNPHAGQGTIHDAATLEREGEIEPLLKSLDDRSTLSLDADSADSISMANRVLHAVMDERTGTAPAHRPSEQQVQLAQLYFERLPDELLQDKHAFQRHARSVLELADETHGGRPALLERMAAALHEHAELTRSSTHTRKMYEAAAYPTDDLRADSQAVVANAKKKIKEARDQEREALRIVRGAGDGISQRIDELMEQAEALRSAAAAGSAELPGAGEPRANADELEREADRLGSSWVRDYRVLKQYVELESADPAQLEMHPCHLMAACLRLARQYADQRDGAGRSGHRPHDIRAPDEMLLRYAERQVWSALDYRLAQGLVGNGEDGRPLPNTRLYRTAPAATSPSLPSSSPGRQHLFSGTSPLFSFGKRAWSTPR